MPRVAEVMAPDRPVLALRLAAATIAAWRSAESETAALAWLDGQGISNLPVARRAVRILGDEAVTILSENPYVLVPLLPWKDVDALGGRLMAGMPPAEREIRRFVGAADEVMKRILRRGDTLIAPDRYRLTLRTLLGTGREDVIEEAVQAAERNGGFIRTDEGFRAPGAALMEDYVVRRLGELGRAGSACPVRLPPPAVSLRRWRTPRRSACRCTRSRRTRCSGS